MTPKTTWAALGRRAKAWRIVHTVWSILQLAGLAEIWRAAISRRRRRGTWAAIAFLFVEGAGLVIGRGSCPAGRLQEGWGDPVPFFELVLPPRAAKAAVPVLFVISLGALMAFAARPARVERTRERLVG
jgi:hypothetical protein